MNDEIIIMPMMYVASRGSQGEQYGFHLRCLVVSWYFINNSLLYDIFRGQLLFDEFSLLLFLLSSFISSLALG